MRAFLQECIENLMVIKSFSNEEMMEQKLTNYQEIHYQIKKKRNAVSNLANTIVYVYGRILCGSGMGCDSDFQRIADFWYIDSFSADHRADPGAVPKYFRADSSIL